MKPASDAIFARLVSNLSRAGLEIHAGPYSLGHPTRTHSSIEGYRGLLAPSFRIR